MNRKINSAMFKKINALSFYIIVLICSQTVMASEFIYHLTTEQWAVPRSVNSILRMSSVSSALQLIHSNAGSSLHIYHPGGDEGILWASELRGWLISLGLSSTNIKLIPGSSDTSKLDLEVILPTNKLIVDYRKTKLMIHLNK